MYKVWEICAFGTYSTPQFQTGHMSDAHQPPMAVATVLGGIARVCPKDFLFVGRCTEILKAVVHLGKKAGIGFSLTSN